jgi:hypothetical protein
MSDALLSVEVITKMEALSAGLKRGEKEIDNFATNGSAALSSLEKMLSSVGVGLSNTNIKGLATDLKEQRIETEKAKAANLLNVASLNAQKLATEQAKAAAISLKNEQIALRNEQIKAASSQKGSKDALDEQRLATERARTATVEFRNEQARLRAEQGKAKMATMPVATGSIAAARIELAELGKQIVYSTNSMSASDPIVARLVNRYADLNDAVKQAEFRMKNYQRDVGNYGKVWDGFAKGSAQAGMALTDVGRIAQDLPYGFIGIQNNLNPMLESFQRLRAETGSTGAAFKAMGSALIGPAGLGFALSAVSAGILIYQQWQQRAAKADEEKEKSLKNLKKTTEDYLLTLDAVTQVNAKGQQNAGKELTSLRLIYEATQNLKLPNEERVKAAKALQEQYPQTFKNFTTEQILLGQTSTQYKQLAADILSVAKAAAGVDFIQDNTKKLVVEQLKYNNATKEFKKVSEELAKLPVRDERAIGSAGIGASSAADAGIQRRNELLAKQAGFQKQINESQKTKTHLTYENLQVEKMLNTEVNKTGKVVSIVGLDKGNTEIKDTTDTIAGLRKEIARLSEMKGSATKGSDVFNKIKALKAELKDLTGSDTGKNTTRQLESVGRQLQDFQNKSNLITKEGLTKDLQEWEDKYEKIKAVIAKMPTGAAKTSATQTLDVNYKEGRSAILDASTKKITDSLNKRNAEIARLEFDGSSREIEAIKDNYNEQIRLAEGNKEGIVALRKQMNDEIAKVQLDQSVKDRSLMAAQIADIAKDYREHRAEMLMLGESQGPVAVEIAENERAKDELKNQYAQRLIDFETFQDQMKGLIEKGNDLEIKPPKMDYAYFKKQTDEITANLVAFKERIINEGIADTLGNTFSSIGEAMVQGGNVFAAAGQAIVSSISGFLSELGQMLMRKGAATVAAGMALNIIAPGSGAKQVAGGISLIAAGAAMSLGSGALGSIGKGGNSRGGSSGGNSGPEYGVPHFAKGALAYGPTLAMVGDNPGASHDPEVIAPLSKLKGMIGDRSSGSTQVMIPEMRLSGQDIVIAFKRAEKNNQRG